MKKLIILLALIMPMLAISQDIEGTWKFHPAYQFSTANDLIDTENHVYALSNGAIVCLDKASNQIQALSPTTGLSDAKVKGIYYNYDKHYLLIAYTSSNIDLLYDDGHIVNISALADAVMNISRSINDVTFADGKILLATGFGLVVIDDTALRIDEFRMYGKSLESVVQVGNRMVIAQDGKLFVSTERFETLSDFTSINIAQSAPLLRPIDDNNFFVMGTGMLKRCAFTTDMNCSSTTIVSARPNNLQRTSGGWLANFRANGYYYTISNDGNFTATKVAGNNTSLYSSAPDGDGTVWQVDGNGIHTKGATDYHKPKGIYLRNSSVVLFHNLYNTWDNKFYVTTADQNAVITDNFTHLKHILTYDGSEWVDATPTGFTSTSKLAKITFIPGHPGSYFATDRSNNFYRVINGQLQGIFKNGKTTSPLQYGAEGNALEPGLLVDPQGNLWMMSTAGNNVLAMLPKNKVLADAVRYSDWIPFDVSKFDLYYPQRQQYFATRDGIKVFTNVYQSSLFNIWRTKPSAADITDIEVVSTQNFVDQNGKAVDTYLNDKYALAADSTDHVWVGTRPGLFYFKASEAFEPNFRVTKPVAHEGEEDPYNISVTAIGVDPMNRKWIGTFDNGLYVVSPDGSRVLAHFDVDNSAMSSSTFFGVSANANRAIVLTQNGVVEFDMTDIANVIDYTAVTAAPMFVEPSYTGFVTIGQVDVGACVRITDRDGNVVREFTATSNQVAWDTCDETGERVPTGVYSIYAGLTADQLPGTPQASVKVIK